VSLTCGFTHKAGRAGTSPTLLEQIIGSGVTAVVSQAQAVFDDEARDDAAAVHLRAGVLAVAAAF